MTVYNSSNFICRISMMTLVRSTASAETTKSKIQDYGVGFFGPLTPQISNGAIQPNARSAE